MEAKAANNTNPTPVYAITVLGAFGTGQSCLIHRFLFGKYENEYESTIENNFLKQVHVNKKLVTLNICDLGYEPIETLSPYCSRIIRGSDGFLITYGINDRSSFEEAKKFYDKIVQLKGDNQTPYVISLCGTKFDLEGQRQVSTQEGQELAQQMGSLFFETSALTNHNVENAFIETVKKITKAPKSSSKRIGDFFSSILTPKK